MFTGIITHLGKVQKKEKAVFTFTTDDSFVQKLEGGTSVSVNGVCLTILEKPRQNVFSIEIMPETQQKTTMSSLKENDIVNLELPATPNTFLSGHIVQGHVDATAQIKDIQKTGNSYLFTITILTTLNKYIVEKGSITLNGISLTVITIGKDFFTVGIIPHTWKNTMLHTVKKGDFVNIEVDVLAKYVERLIIASQKLW